MADREVGGSTAHDTADASECEGIVVEQLNHAQWHAVSLSRGATGIGSYVEALSIGLIWSELDQCSVRTVDLRGSVRLMAVAASLRQGASTWAQ